MILEYIERTTAFREVEELWGYHKAVMASYGFNRVIYGFTRFLTTNSLGDPRDLVVLTNHDEAYMQDFLNGGLFRAAPMTLWALRHVGACSWRCVAAQAEAGELGESARHIWEFNRKNGLEGGYTISFASNSRRVKGAIGLTAVPKISFDEAERIWTRHGRTISAMNNVMHLRIMSMPNLGHRRPLTSRQREALEWVGDGKTTAEIAAIMGLTSATVEKHLRLARENLSAGTTAQAVLKASFLNQIYVMDDPFPGK